MRTLRLVVSIWRHMRISTRRKVYLTFLCVLRRVSNAWNTLGYWVFPRHWKTVVLLQARITELKDTIEILRCSNEHLKEDLYKAQNKIELLKELIIKRR